MRTVGGKIDTTTLIIMINVVDLIGCPKNLRTDPGTENSIVAVVQPAFRHSGNDSFAGLNSHRYGKSPSNKVILSVFCVVGVSLGCFCMKTLMMIIITMSYGYHFVYDDTEN